MARKPRGAKGRLASPAQMARLRALLQLNPAQPVSFEAYRHMMRSYMNADANLETAEAAWKHLEKKRATPRPAWMRALLPALDSLVQGG
jgi:hypothetical protein